MSFIKTKAFIALICFALGAISMYTSQRLLFHNKTDSRVPLHADLDMEPLFDRFFNEDFFDKSRNPFQELRRMREGMVHQFNKEEGSGIFDSWYKKKFGGGNAGEVVQREDKHSVFYDISVDGLKDDNLSIKVANGQITIAGQVENKTEDKGGRAYYSSSFHRSFPVPSNVDPDSLKVEKQKEKMILRFDKK